VPPTSERTALLIGRARIDERSLTPLRVQLRGNDDLAHDLSGGLVVTDVEAACGAVRAWLEALLASVTVS
jgi:hypothetical protein